MIHSEQFHDNIGFDLHARTTIDSFYSYIEAAALRVGAHTLELEKQQFFVNGAQHSYNELPLNFGDKYEFKITMVQSGKTTKEVLVDLHNGSSIVFKFYKHFLSFKLAGRPSDFRDSVGLLGEFGTGDMYSRDGVPMDDFTQCGFEWQVDPSEDPVLFRNRDRSPQLPYEVCRVPTAARPSRRMLRKDHTLLEQAQAACAKLQGHDVELCVSDVMMTGDIGLASTW